MDSKVSKSPEASRSASEQLDRLSSELSQLSSKLRNSKEMTLHSIEDLPKVLRSRRKQLNIPNQEEAAVLSDVSSLTYKKAEQENGNPTLSTLKSIAEGLNLKIWIEEC